MAPSMSLKTLAQNEAPSLFSSTQISFCSQPFEKIQLGCCSHSFLYFILFLQELDSYLIDFDRENVIAEEGKQILISERSGGFGSGE
jgi:hypothetical protein